MLEYTVHFQRGTCVGARSLRMVTVQADDVKSAVTAAKREWQPEPGYRLIRVDHFENGHLVIDR